jgi:hypothetical protein
MTGRPRLLDETKRREIGALLAAGESLPRAARYVGCSVRTIRRERERNEAFDQELRIAESNARLEPVKAMRQAMHTHWRAAAWMLERTQPERYGRNQKNSMGKRELRALANDLVSIVKEEVLDPFVSERIEQRVQATVNYAMRHAWDQRRTGPKLRQAMEFFEKKDVQQPWSDPLAAAQEAPNPMDASYPPEGYCYAPEGDDQQPPEVGVEPSAGDGMQELVQQFVRLATLPETEEEKAERLAERGGDLSEGSLDDATGQSQGGAGDASRRTSPAVGISTERKSTMGDSTFGAALRARLTELVASGADVMEESAGNTKVSADRAPESEATFGAKKEGAMSETEPNEPPASSSSGIATQSVTAAQAGNHALSVNADAA